MVKNLPAMQETRVRSLGQEDPLEGVMAIYSSVLAWRILWPEETGGLVCAVAELDTTEQLTHSVIQYTLFTKVWNGCHTFQKCFKT